MSLTRPRVWAPTASSVEIDVAGTRHPMKRDGEWWEAPVDLAAGARYGFVVDGRGPMPDPRSRSQPDGVHGPSRLLTPTSPPSATDTSQVTRELADSIFYELHVGTFSEEGTFDGVVGHLDALVDLGVTTVELMPVAEFPGRWGWGYDGVDLFAPHHGYGGPDGLLALVAACHQRGLAVVLDVVYNHLGPDGNYLDAYGPYFTDRYATPWGDAVNLDGRGSDEVRAFIVDNARMWLNDYGFDGLRLDAVHAFADQSAVHILEELTAAVDEAAPGKLVIAESDLNDPRLLKPRGEGGYGVHAQWSDDFHHALHSALTGETAGYYGDFGSLAAVADALQHGFVYRGQHSAFRGRRHGRPLDGVPMSRLLGYSQNHDQVGNRARGDRLCHLVSEGRQRIAAALTILGPFTPMLFMGEEWAASTPFQYFTDHGDPDLGRAVSEGRRREFVSFGWQPEDVPDPQAETTFRASVLRWEERDRPANAALLAFYRDLIALRRERHEIRTGDVEVRVDGPERLEMRRGGVSVRIDLRDDALEIVT